MQDPHPSRNGRAVKPLTNGDECLLLKRAGLMACEVAKIASATRYGWTGVRTWLALFEYASIDGRGFYGRYATLAARLGVSQRQVERLLPALAKAALATKEQPFGEKAVWWPRHPTTAARLPLCEAAADEPAEQPEQPSNGAVSPSSSILTDETVGDTARKPQEALSSGHDGVPTAQKPSNDAVSPNSASIRTATVTSSDVVLRTTPVRNNTSSTKKGSAKPRPPASNEPHVEAAGLVATQKDNGSGGRLERVPPRALGFHGGVAVMVGRSSLGEYVLFDHPRLKAAGRQFITAPGALEMDLAQAVVVADDRLRSLDAGQRRVDEVVARLLDGPWAQDRAHAVLADLFTPARTAAFDDALKDLRTEEDLRRVMDACEAARRYLPHGLRDARLDIAKVVGVMVQIPSPETYVRMLVRKGLDHPAAVFHPNTLARARSESESVFDTAASRNVDAAIRELRAQGYE